MGTVSRTAYSSGATITAALQNSNENAIVNEINGNLDNDNIKSGANIAASKINLATIAQTMALSGVAMNWAKGSDIASATTCDIGAASGNYLDVTGTTTITGLGTVQAGTVRFVRFTGALTLTHNGTSLMLPTANNITTVAGDTAEFVSLGSGNWKCLWYQRYDGSALVSATVSNALSGSVIQTVSTTYTTTGSGTTAIPFDTSIPQNTEGDQVTTLAITPNNSSNTLIIDVSTWVSNSSATNKVAAALFQDSTANALSVGMARIEGTAAAYLIRIRHIMTAGTTSATTFKLRVGGEAGTSYWNRSADTDNLFGAVMKTSIVIQEIKA